MIATPEVADYGYASGFPSGMRVRLCALRTSVRYKGVPLAESTNPSW